MLESCLFETSGEARRRKPAMLIASTILHAAGVLALLLLPLLHPQVVPVLSAAAGIPLETLIKTESKPQPAAPVAVVQPHIQPSPNEFIEPTEIPADIAKIVDVPAIAGLEVAPSSRADVISLVRNMTEHEVADPPPPPPAPAASLAQPTRVGGNVQLANLVYQVRPEYPALARQARVSGVVLLEATIARDGSVRDVRVISGHVLLTQAAIDAVQQWKYKPTFLNGDPVEVITTVTVTFNLQ